MANMVNINRCKIPKLVTKVEHKGNQVKTVIVNLPEIAKLLNRPLYLMKYFNCLLDAKVNFNRRTGLFIINRSHNSDELQVLFDIFIEKYVQCKSCESFETILAVNKEKEFIAKRCTACSHSSVIHADNDWVAAKILKNPPANVDATAPPPPSVAVKTIARSAATGPLIGQSKTGDQSERASVQFPWLIPLLWGVGVFMLARIVSDFASSLLLICCCCVCKMCNAGACQLD